MVTGAMIKQFVILLEVAAMFLFRVSNESSYARYGPSGQLGKISKYQYYFPYKYLPIARYPKIWFPSHIYDKGHRYLQNRM